MGRFKKFNGTTYTLYASESTKTEAEKLAKRLRAKGKSVRIQRYSGYDLRKNRGVGYNIYVR